MVNTKVAQKYARALLDVALASNAVNDIGEQLKKAVALTDAVPQLLAVFRHPRISRDRKKQLVQRFFAEPDYSPLMRDFLSLLIDRKRAALLPAIQRRYVELVNELRNLMPARVTTAIPLNEAERAMILQRLKELTGRDILLQADVDPGVLGGLVIRVGGHLIDGSLASHLAQVKERLKQVRVTNL
ncbi:MAG: ATP synthase F1 subunit delta [Abditibacteriales bacterium]|nr:ATP synthase F1 subunit delta [Abditibacteriales bacterium]MDW8364775.1 ATP synthase F1 subunit delta [Abditibacteriales bacterium]